VLIENSNPRYTSIAMWWPSVGLAALGFVDAAYLTWIKLTGGAVACSNIGDCEVVNNSRYAVIGGVPIALLGAGTYLLILVLLGLERSNPAAGEATRMAVFGFALVGTLYSAYLTYVEFAVLKAICPYCVASAIILTLLLVLSIIRLRQPWVEES